MSFRWRGIRFFLSFWFFWGAALLLLGDRSGLCRLFLGAAAIHEGGHLLYLLRAGLPLGEVRLTPLGLILRLGEGCRLSHGQDLLLNLTGCGANFLAAAFSAWLPGGGMAALRFSAVNAALGAANLLPVPGLDGAQALEDLLVLALGWERGGRICRGLMKALSLGGGALCLFFLARDGVSLSLLCLFGIFLAGLLPGKVESRR